MARTGRVVVAFFVLVGIVAVSFLMDPPFKAMDISSLEAVVRMTVAGCSVFGVVGCLFTLATRFDWYRQDRRRTGRSSRRATDVRMSKVTAVTLRRDFAIDERQAQDRKFDVIRAIDRAVEDN